MEGEPVVGQAIWDVDHPLREHELPGEPFSGLRASELRSVAKVKFDVAFGLLGFGGGFGFGFGFGGLFMFGREGEEGRG